ncbi:MAG TPA: DUF2834 domain-containing protein [Thermoanaerobaculia bacterium]|nr:DUF2834 domain-containing protein [Thermoanaerobaculia bacterium]
MKMLAVLGFLLPLAQFARFVRDHGLDVKAFLTLPFANPAAAMFSTDLLISCVVFWLFVYASRVRRPWLYVVMTLLVGLSFALPMFVIAFAKSEHFGATLPLTSDDGQRAAAPARASGPVG